MESHTPETLVCRVSRVLSFVSGLLLVSGAVSASNCVELSLLLQHIADMASSSALSHLVMSWGKGQPGLTNKQHAQLSGVASAK